MNYVLILGIFLFFNKANGTPEMDDLGVKQLFDQYENKKEKNVGVSTWKNKNKNKYKAPSPFDFGDLAPEGIVYYKINGQNFNSKFGFI